MIRKSLIIMIGMVLMLISSACRATPEKPVVVGKDLKQMLELAASGQDEAGSLAERLSVPKRCEAKMESATGNFRITVDADIILPEAESIPIVFVEAQPFDQQTIDTLISVLFDGGKLYDPYTLSVQTKSEINQLLVQMRERKMKLERQGFKPQNPDIDAENSPVSDVAQPLATSASEATSTSEDNQLDSVNKTIRELEEKLVNAPENKDLKEVTGKLKQSIILEGLPEEELKEYEGKLIEHVNAGQLNPEGGMRSVYISNNEMLNDYRVEYINRGDFSTSCGQYYSEDSWLETADAAGRERLSALPDMSLTAGQAQDITEDFLQQIGLDYLTCVQKEKVIGFYGEGSRAGAMFKAFSLQYVRKVQNVPVTYTYIDGASGDVEGLVWNWRYEKMTLIVDDSGIVGMLWEAPYRLLETYTYSTAMLPFSQIKDVFEKMIVIGNSYYTQIGADMHITEVRLGLARISEQNNLTSGLLIPVWDFFGTLTTYYEEDGQPRSHTLKEPGQVWLTINAIDGSIVDRSLGH